MGIVPYSDEDALSAGLSLSYQPIKNLHLGLSLEHYQPNSQAFTRSLSGYIAYSAFKGLIQGPENSYGPSLWVECALFSQPR